MSGAACRQRRNRSLITATTHGSAYGRLPPPSARLTRLLRHRSLPTPAKLSLTRTTRPCSYHLITCTITSTASFAYHFCHYYCCSSSSIWIYLDLFGSIWVYLGLFGSIWVLLSVAGFLWSGMIVSIATWRLLIGFCCLGRFNSASDESREQKPSSSRGLCDTIVEDDLKRHLT